MENERSVTDCDLAQLSASQMQSLSDALGGAGAGAKSMEEAAGSIVRLLYERLRTGEGDRATVLIRLFKTHAFGGLPPDLRAQATAAAGDQMLYPETRCLILLATAGVEPAWNSRQGSVNHQAIPLKSYQMVEQFPMISQLVRQFGLAIAHVVKPEPRLFAASERKLTVFDVPEARGSSFVPAQDEFVIPYGVRSAVGFGGLFPTGDIHAVIIFTRVPVPRPAAELFQSAATSIGQALRPLLGVTFGASS